MYENSFSQGLIYQGDIFRNLGFLLPLDAICWLPGISKEFVVRDSSEAYFQKSLLVQPSALYVHDGLIVSQNCDIDNRAFVLVSPVFPLAPRYGTNRDHMNELRRQKVNYEVHLPPTATMGESFADLQLICPVKKEALLVQNRVAVLSDYGRAILQDHLREFFARTEVKPFIGTIADSSSS